ncbi:MAG: preprotein translocase subunit SecY [Chloroflexota bacterium]
MLQAALNAFKIPDLRRKLLFTLGVLVIYRLAAAIPVPGIDRAAFNNLLSTYKIFQLLSLFSGGSGGFSIVSLGVYPYITAQIAIQILLPVIPRLEEISRDGEAGRTKLNQITRLVTIPLAMLQAYGQGVLISNTAGTGSSSLLTNFGFFGGDVWATLGFMLVMTTGTLFLIWLGELITESGVGNGISLIIFAGIIARLPSLVSEQLQSNNVTLLVGIAILAVIVIGAIVFVQEAQRRIPVQYARRLVRGRMTQAQSTHIPLRVNSAGMIPLIFAFSIVTTPAIVASYFQPSHNTIVRNAATWIVGAFNQDSAVYWILTFILVFGFTYFYTTVQWQQQKLSENLQKNGGFIPGYRPGKHTEDYLNRVLNRITLGGALFLAVIATLPFLARPFTTANTFTLSSTALLIVVAVVIDTMKQLEAQLMMRNYQSFIR